MTLRVALALVWLTSAQLVNAETLKLLTLNLAHARASGHHQLFQSTASETRNLKYISEILRREGADVVALQEVDRDSFWNGRFDHAKFLAEEAGYANVFFGSHHRSEHLDYGTALLANESLKNPRNVVFSKPVLRPAKGFVVALVPWQEAGLEIDLVSLHFDFLSKRRQLAEAKLLVEMLSARRQLDGNPIVLMGDFNSDQNGAAIRLLQGELQLTLSNLDAELVTFPLLGKRIDWILVTEELSVVSERTLPEALSDHRAVVAEIGLNPRWATR